MSRVVCPGIVIVVLVSLSTLHIRGEYLFSCSTRVGMTEYPGLLLVADSVGSISMGSSQVLSSVTGIVTRARSGIEVGLFDLASVDLLVSGPS